MPTVEYTDSDQPARKPLDPSATPIMYEVTGAEEDVVQLKSGTHAGEVFPRIKIQLQLSDANGGGGRARDGLIFAPSLAWKLAQFRASHGVECRDGEPISFEVSDVAGVTGEVEVTPRQYVAADGSSKTAWDIAAYKPHTTPAPTAPTAREDDDETPF